MDTDTGGWESCPQGSVPCSTNSVLGGSTVCASTITDCPVFDMLILSKDSSNSKLNDPNYIKVYSDDGELAIVYTKGTNDRSNEPLQSIEWQNGMLCAYTDQAAVQMSGSMAPEYYPLEAVTNLKSCQNFYK